MHRMFIDECPGSHFRKKMVVDMDTGFYEKYSEDKEFGVIFSHHTDNVVTMGWATPEQFLKCRYQAKQSIPEKNIRRVSDSVREVNYFAEMRRERQRQLDWGAWLLQKHGKHARHLGELYRFMQRYGLSPEQARRKIAGIHRHGGGWLAGKAAGHV